MTRPFRLSNQIYRLDYTIANPKDPDNKYVINAFLVALLRGVADTGSLLKTTKQMGHAYSHTWTYIKGVEENFGIKLLERHGTTGSTLTEDGQHILELFTKNNDIIATLIKRIISYDRCNEGRI